MESTRTSNADSRTSKILVVANRTCPCPVLVEEVATRASNASSEVLVVAPALNSRLRHWVSDTDRAVGLAQDRVRLAVDALCEFGVDARGEVGDANPLLAIADALAGFAATEIIIATHPPGQSNWLERGLIEKARTRFGTPITHLVSAYGLVERAAAA